MSDEHQEALCLVILLVSDVNGLWSRERIRALKDEVEAAGLNLSGIESVNIHDAIKTGAPEREQYIENKSLGEDYQYMLESIRERLLLVERLNEIFCRRM